MCVSLPDKPSYAYQIVRTDAKEQKLDAFVLPRSLQLTAVQEAAADTPPLSETTTEHVCPPQDKEEEVTTDGVEEEAMEVEKTEDDCIKVEASDVTKYQKLEKEDSTKLGSDRKRSTGIASFSTTKTSSSATSRPLSSGK